MVSREQNYLSGTVIAGLDRNCRFLCHVRKLITYFHYVQTLIKNSTLPNPDSQYFPPSTDDSVVFKTVRIIQNSRQDLLIKWNKVNFLYWLGGIDSLWHPKVSSTISHYGHPRFWYRFIWCAPHVLTSCAKFINILMPFFFFFFWNQTHVDAKRESVVFTGSAFVQSHLAQFCNQHAHLINKYMSIFNLVLQFNQALNHAQTNHLPVEPYWDAIDRICNTQL